MSAPPNRLQSYKQSKASDMNNAKVHNYLQLANDEGEKFCTTTKAEGLTCHPILVHCIISYFASWYASR